MRLAPAALETVFAALSAAYGAQGWWPARTPFEVMVGAVLTQRTAWRNVEIALLNLANAGVLEAPALRCLPLAELEALVRPAGFYRQKAARLRRLCDWLARHGGFDGAAGLDDAGLRASLLDINGVGPETADAILLYAFRRRTFVVDAYARRIFARLGLIRGDESYEALRSALLQAGDGDTARQGEYHALLVAHAKVACRTRPRCQSCALAAACPQGSAVERAGH